MSWDAKNKAAHRFSLVEAMGRGELTVAALCRQWRISRKSAYKWRARYREGGVEGLKDRASIARRVAGRLDAQWQRRLREWHRRYPGWGPRKIWVLARQGRRGAAGPSETTVKRWFSRWGWARQRPRRVRRGTPLERPRLRAPRRPNEVWTVDFKGWFRTGDGRRIEPLTVRDLYSRFVLAVELLSERKIRTAQAAMHRIFRKWGLPERIRCDNGDPFGSLGCMGLSRLSAWWRRLGIEVEFIDPGRPDQNGAHEQMHRILKADTARPPARNLGGQQARTRRWLEQYNEVRPHEGIGLQVPAQRYRRSRRQLPRSLRQLRYPAGWERHWVKGSGEITRQGQRWFIGEAFAGYHVGLKPGPRKGRWQVYFGHLQLGELVATEPGSMRPRYYRRSEQRRRGFASGRGPATARYARLRRASARR